jgi:hypothetical protein
MTLDFQRGDPDNPTGHAILYYIDSQDGQTVFATYLVVPPIKIELAKYMPPMFASNVSLSDVDSVSAVPLPPVPERVESLSYIQILAESREDDLVSGGLVNASDVERMLLNTSEAAQDYLRLYKSRPALPEPFPGIESPSSGEDDVDDLLIPLMSDKDKLGEISRLAGSMRYAVEGNDQATAEELRSQMETLGRHLGEKFKIAELIKAALTPGIMASRLSALYTERCYKLCDEDYLEVARIEGEIEKLTHS